MKSLRDEICLTAGYGDADLISSEAKRRRFHPSLRGFHRAQHDFIKNTKLTPWCKRFEPQINENFSKTNKPNKNT